MGDFNVEVVSDDIFKIIIYKKLYEKQAIFSEIVGKKYCINNIVIIPIYHPSPISPKSYNGNVEIFENIKKYIGEI